MVGGHGLVQPAMNIFCFSIETLVIPDKSKKSKIMSSLNAPLQ